jgi:hypothetical protein
MNIQQVKESTKQLDFDDKALVAHCLITSHDTKQDECVEQEWAELAERRYEELVSEKAKSLSWDEVKKEVKG